ncbi:MAG: oligoendopeptidase F [Opitutaceae bacterium]|nr:oligoendopeptidase F [Opitutaceae bacterium]
MLSPASAAPSASTKPATRTRAEIPVEYRWDFSPMFQDWAAWEAGIRELEGKMDAYAALKGTLAQGPQAVLHAYQLADEIGKLQYLVYRYPQLQRDTDTRDQAVAGYMQRVSALFAKFGTATAWFSPELLAISEDTMRTWIASTPALETYRFPILDEYRQQKHVLDEKGERLLSFAARFNRTPSNVFTEITTSDIQFPTIELSDGSALKLSPAAYQAALRSQRKQEDRRKAFENYYAIYTANKNTYAAIYDGVLQRGWFMAQARNYPSTLDAALEANAIPPAVVDTLVSTVRSGTAPLQRYLRLRKKLLGLESYHIYDNFVPIVEDKEVFPYEKARTMVLESVAPLGADYQGKMKRFVSGGRIDVYENEGKRSGAYCAGVYGVGPYLLLNYAETLSDLFTLAHEAGHAMHTVLSYEAQPFVTSGYTIFVAEVASTTNERLLLEKMLAESKDPKERFLLLQHAIEEIIGTFYTQTMFADFELQAHRRVEQGQPVTAETLSAIYQKLLEDYYGDAVTIDEPYKYTWARIPHFYNSPYYVYQYATCFASSAQIFHAMTTGDTASRAAATERYLTLLRSGGNDYPMEQLRKAGVDLARRETVQAVVDQLDELVTRLEKEAAAL